MSTLTANSFKELTENSNVGYNISDNCVAFFFCFLLMCDFKIRSLRMNDIEDFFKPEIKENYFQLHFGAAISIPLIGLY